ISVRGKPGLRGHTLLEVSRPGDREPLATLNVAVRIAKRVPAVFHYLKDRPANRGTRFGRGDGARLLAEVNKLYKPQANVEFFLSGGEIETTKVNNKTVDVELVFIISDKDDEGLSGSPSWSDFIADSPGRLNGVVHVFRVAE